VLRRPLVLGHQLTIEGGVGDLYVGALGDGAPYADEVLRLLEAVVPADAHVVDVGANVGIHALAVSRLAPEGHVHAFEPNPATVAHLSTNVRANDAGNVTVYPLALGEVPGEVLFFNNGEYAAGSMIIDASPSLLVDLVTAKPVVDAPVVLTVPCETLDHALSGVSRIDLIKIDTEGHDIDVLRGAKATIDRCRPAVIIEFSSYGLTMHAQRLPHEALAELRATFDRLFALESDGTLREIASDMDALDLLHENAVVRPVQDLVGVFESSSLLAPILRRAENPGPRRTTELAWLHERTQTLEAALGDAQAAAEWACGRVGELNAHVDHITTQVDHLKALLVQAETRASTAETHIEALEATRTFRWTRQLRLVYSRLRTRGIR
jgi:FkbM family methyltransferase